MCSAPERGRHQRGQHYLAQLAFNQASRNPGPCTLSSTHLQDLDLGGVRGPNVEALQVGLKHTLTKESIPGKLHHGPSFASSDTPAPPSTGPMFLKTSKCSSLPPRPWSTLTLIYFFPLGTCLPVAPSGSKSCSWFAFGVSKTYTLHTGLIPLSLYTTLFIPPQFPCPPCSHPLSQQIPQDPERVLNAHPALDGHGGHILEHYVLHLAVERMGHRVRNPSVGRRGGGSGKTGWPKSWEEGREGG